MNRPVRHRPVASLVPAVAVCAAVLLGTATHGAERAAPRDSVAMITIAAGPFRMGAAAPGGRADEQPEHVVELDAFAIDAVEVTNERYLQFVEETGHRAPPNPYGAASLAEMPGIADLPVVQVTWYDAADYCRWAGKRLPTEAEWEKAARGGDTRRFPWGGEAPKPGAVNFDREWAETRTLRPVGTTAIDRSPYGVFDLAGNAREWVQDWYASDVYASDGARRQPTGPPDGILKVIRGGSWHSPIQDIRTTARGKGGFALKTDGLGFRCARSLS